VPARYPRTVEWWQILLLSIALALVVMVVGGLLLWRLLSNRTKRLARRIGALPSRRKLRLARDLVTDKRIPVAVRLILPLLVLYLSLPLDIVPDFIPVLGQLDDIVMVVVAVALLVRFTPMSLLEEHLAAQEAAAAAQSARIIEGEVVERPEGEGPAGRLPPAPGA
jgi:uncharacterized membrane protein YkvA (DUF1232 family)